MDSTLTFCLFAISFLICSKVTFVSGKLVVIRDPPTGNDTPVNLTCISEDDGAALVWNYYKAGNGTDVSTDFEPKKPVARSPNDCGLWNSTCIGRWDFSEDWDLVDSAIRPMAPVFDYRWEGFREISSSQITSEKDQEPQYVKQLTDPSGTVFFSARGSTDLHIFLCQFEDPEEGPCFRVVLGSWSKNRSRILNCDSGKLEDESCEEVAKVTHENAIMKGYEWRTFRLEWSAEEKTIKVFQNTDRDPFLEGPFDKWHNVSHLSVGRDTESRVRFHFYDYFLTTRKNAVLSTTEFLQPDKNFCIELMVGLCTDCRLDVSLMNSGADVPLGSIPGLGNEERDELMRWRSVRINTTLPDSKLIKLKIETEMIKGGVEGRWAIDHFRTCEPVGGLRKSTIPIDRMRMTSTTSFWPEVKCQKLSYVGSELVDSPLIYIFPGHGEPVGEVRSDVERLTVDMDEDSQASGDDRHLIVKRDIATENAEDKVYMKHQETGEGNSGSSLSIHKRDSITGQRDHSETLQIYEGDQHEQTVSIRLAPLDLVLDGVDSYHVKIVTGGNEAPYQQRFAISPELHCKLWDDALCIQNLSIVDIRGFGVTGSKIMVSGEKNEQKVAENQWECLIQFDLHTKDPSAPGNLMITFPDPGIVKFKWKHPWYPYTKIQRFRIQLTVINTTLIESQKVVNVTVDHSGVPEQKEYETELQLPPSSTYDVEVVAENQHGFGRPAKHDFTTPSRIGFESAENLSVRYNETWISFRVPAVINATLDTWVTVTVQGSLKCSENESKESPSTDQVVFRKSSLVSKYKVKEVPSRSFNISENGTHNSDFTCYLRPGYTYVIKAEAKDNVTNESASPIKSIEITLPSSNGEGPAPQEIENKTNLGWLVIIPIIAIVAVLLFIFYRKRRKSSIGTSREEFTPIQKSEVSNRVGRSSPAANLTNNNLTIESERSAPDVVPKSPSYSFPVPIDQFEEHTKDALASGLLQAQYEKISEYPRKPHEYGSLPENATKNRYQDLTAYDHSRVKLKKISGDDYSDYINANYIKGYNKAKAYIATQGPKPNTVKDFWRMIWQEKVTVICMLANVKEGRKTKCEKYWPDVDAKAAEYGDIKVLNTTHEVFADYTIRRLHVNVHKETRTITHLHYTGWPDHGVPMYTQSLVSYIQKLREMKTEAGGPVVVHCSAGVGRTGTIILCDVCLSQAEEKMFVDPLGTTVQMREDRSNMVDSKQQYLLAHLTIVESRILEQTQVPCTAALPKMISELRKRLESDIKRLDEIVWQERALHEIAEPRRPSEDGTAENSDDESFVAGVGSNCINAVSVAGVKMKEQYLAARLPTASTLSDFWELIAEYRIELVVILQSPDPDHPKYCDIVSSESTFSPAPDIEVETKADTVMELHYSVKKLSLTVGSEETETPQPVTVLTCNDWVCRKNGKPPNPGALVSLWIASEKISRKESPTLVICRDGVTGCGLYLALSFLLERMAVETECDVISAVRAVRRSQPDFVKSIDQFHYLYDAATNYHECFKTYGNMA